ncbi:hypothetical protein ABZ784_26040 [Streptomyces tendae]|uniref:hypothetical protein n=1 Tax=Streptomyces tendae TaxID=1932 RepID=UPI0033EBBC88
MTAAPVEASALGVVVGGSARRASTTSPARCSAASSTASPPFGELVGRRRDEPEDVAPAKDQRRALPGAWAAASV